MRPDLLDLSASSARPGQTIEVRFPEGTLRGIAWVLEEQDGDTWHARYYLTAATDGHEAGSPSWWSVNDSEGRGWEDIGVEGPGPDALVIPDPTRPGAYRLCTANSIPNICTALDIVD